MFRLFGLLLVGLVLSFATLLIISGEAVAKNWNVDDENNSETPGQSIVWKYPSANYIAKFKCSQTGAQAAEDMELSVSQKKISLILDGNEVIDYQRASGKVSSEYADLKQTFISGMQLSDIGSFMKTLDRPRVLAHNQKAELGQTFRESNLKFMGLKGSVEFKLQRFERHDGLHVASGKYTLKMSGRVQGARMQGEFSGTLKYHLGSGLIVYNSFSGSAKANGQKVKIDESVLRCGLLGPEKLHQSLYVALGLETDDESQVLANQHSNSSSGEVTAAQKEAERLRQELAALKSQQEQQQQSISNDNQIPLITATSRRDSQTNAVISGQVTDNVAVAEVIIDGEAVGLGDDGSFTTSFYVPRSGKTVEIIAFDKKGNKANKSLFIERGEVQQTTGPVFASLNPSGKRVKSNKDALALIIGVADYQRTPAKAAYADKDAQTFYDYAMLKLGIPAGNIKELVNVKAGRVDVSLAIKDWISRSTKQSQSDIYVFFAGHGLASDDGEKMYLLPYDGSPRLLEDSAISRERLFADISAAKPRSVTVFLDTCYSGTTRGTDMLIASRPIAIRALEQSIPDNFTVMTAAAGDQTAKPLEEAKHGVFSYFLMKGMEGEADANNDNEITAGELHSYVQTNVIQQSSGSQTPELQGDADRVLVRFQ